jgi:hypothetical protein
MVGALFRSVWAAVAVAGAVSLAACNNGPLVNDSGFESSAVSLDGKVLVVAYHRLTYRPATGLAAFPDGGVPKYERDSIVLGLANADGSGMRVLKPFPADGMLGSSHITVRAQLGDPQHMLVVLTDQLSARDMPRARRWRLDLDSATLEPLPDIERELAMVGRRLGAKAFGDVRLAAPDGTLLLGVNEGGGQALWLRTAAGRLRPLDPLTDFYGQVDDEVYLWSGDQGLVHNWRTDERRVIARADPVTKVTKTLVHDDPTVAAIERNARKPGTGAIVAPDRQSVSVDAHEVHLDMAALRH